MRERADVTQFDDQRMSRMFDDSAVSGQGVIADFDI